jgi:hypothetical protein
MEGAPKGKTLWEMLLDRVHRSGGDGGSGAGITFDNPLDLRVRTTRAIRTSVAAMPSRTSFPRNEFGNRLVPDLAGPRGFS